VWNCFAIIVFAVIVIVFPFVSACSPSSPRQELRIDGELSYEHLNALANSRTDIERIVIRSSGGRADISSKIAEIVLEENIQVHINDYCFSACFEFIAAAASKLSVSKNALIGVHGNPITTHWLMGGTSSIAGADECENNPLQIIERIYSARNLDRAFSRVQLELLKPGVVRSDRVGTSDCKGIEFEFKYKLWYPTTVEIEKFLGKKLEGSVCADHQSCIDQKIRQKNASNSCIVRDKVVPCL